MRLYCTISLCSLWLQKGDTPLHIAIRGRSRRLAELLLRNPKDGRLLYRPNKAGETPYNIDCSHQKSILTQIFGARKSGTRSPSWAQLLINSHHWEWASIHIFWFTILFLIPFWFIWIYSVWLNSHTFGFISVIMFILLTYKLSFSLQIQGSFSGCFKSITHLFKLFI